jgi:methylated-DNA-protein-cysteine methyltransferase-like protein
MATGRNQRVYAAVGRIPRGRVATYGQIAKLIGLPGGARQVGYALHDLPDGTLVPWHRVINTRGEVSRRKVFGSDLAQRMRLQREGVQFSSNGRVDLAHFGWRPKTSRRAAAQRPPASARPRR